MDKLRQKPGSSLSGDSIGEIVFKARGHLLVTHALEAAIAKDRPKKALAFGVRYVVDAIVRQRLGVARIAGARNKPCRLHSRHLQGALGWKGYLAALAWLDDHKLVKTDGRYIPGERSKSYGITAKGWRGGIVAVEMTVAQRGRYDRARARLKRDSDAKRNREGVPLAYMEFHLGELSFDERKVLEHFQVIREQLEVGAGWEAWEKQYAHAYSTAMVIEKDWTFHRCAAGRLHYAFTNLPKELRQVLRYNGEELVEVDVQSCQPFLASCLYDGEHEDERRRYMRDVKSGKFYEQLGEAAGWRGERNELKKEVLASVFFGSEEQACGAVWDAFRSLYPGLSEIILEGKRGLEAWRGDRDLALRLQGEEARIVIDGALARIAKEMPGAPAFPVHDCLVTLERHAKEVEQIMREEFEAAMGAAPSFKVEGRKFGGVFDWWQIWEEEERKGQAERVREETTGGSPYVPNF